MSAAREGAPPAREQARAEVDGLPPGLPLSEPLPLLMGVQPPVPGIVNGAEPGHTLLGDHPAPHAPPARRRSGPSHCKVGPILSTVHAVAILSAPGSAVPSGLLAESAKALPPEMFPGPYPDLRKGLPGQPDHPEWPDITNGLQDWVGNLARLKRAIAEPAYPRAPGLQPDPRRRALDAWIREKTMRIELVVEAASESGEFEGDRTKREVKRRWAASVEGKEFERQCAQALYNASVRSDDAARGFEVAVVAAIEVMWVLHDFALCHHSVKKMASFASGLLLVYPDPL